MAVGLSPDRHFFVIKQSCIILDHYPVPTSARTDRDLPRSNRHGRQPDLLAVTIQRMPIPRRLDKSIQIPRHECGDALLNCRAAPRRTGHRLRQCEFRMFYAP